MRKVALVSNTDFGLYNFRMGLIRALVARGYEVCAVCPQGEYVGELTGGGVRHCPVHIDRKGTNLIVELRALWQLYRVLRGERFDAIHSFTIKPNIYGNMAARMAGIPVTINCVTGLGYVFADDGARRRLLRTLVVGLYRLAFRFSSRVVFLNNDDLEVFRGYGIGDNGRAVLIRSEGVDTEVFSPAKTSMAEVQELRRNLGLSDDPERVVITLISRLLWDKGIGEFLQAARTLKSRNPKLLFLLVGPIDEGNRAAVPREYVRRAEEEGFVSYLGVRRDVREILYVSDVVTLPSYYREGVPRVLLEAMSMAKPVVTTDYVGCREVVDEGKNGFLVPPKDHEALAAALLALVNDSELRVRMGKHGRQKAIDEFDESLVVRTILRVYDEVLGPGS